MERYFLHNNAIDKIVFKSFIDRFQKNISNDDVADLENQLRRIPTNYQNDVAEVSEITFYFNLKIQFMSGKILRCFCYTHTFIIVNFWITCFKIIFLILRMKKLSNICINWFTLL